MATVSGYVGVSGNFTDFTNPVSLHMTMPANYYPDGTISFSDITQGGAYWHSNHYSLQQTMKLFLCDSNGNNRVELCTITLMPQASQPTPNSAIVSGATGLAGKALYLIGTGNPDFINLKNRTTVSVGTKAAAHTITINNSTNAHGNVTANTYSAVAGATVTLTASPDTGYQLSGYSSSPSVTITNGKFTMPDSNITITPSFSARTYTITKKNSPSAGGSVTCSSSAQYKSSVSVQASAATGYKFSGWTTSPSGLISSASSNPASFTMPASNVTVTANYMKRSTATISSTNLTGDENIALTVDADKSTYSHKYTFSFTGGISLTGTMNAGVSSKTITVPLAEWASLVATNSKTASGSVTVYTYSSNTQNNSTLIGSYTISGLTYIIPNSAAPEINPIVKTLVMDDPATYGEVSTSLYIQNHAKVNIMPTATPKYNATITKLEISLNGYSSSSYKHTYNNSGSGSYTPSGGFETGILTISGTQRITIKATDSRGFTKTVTTTISVKKYSKPTGTLKVWRVNNAGTRDEMGTYGKFEITKSYTNIGDNALDVYLKVGSGSPEQITGTSGNILPSGRVQFNQKNEYTIRLILTDKLESTTITAKLSSARYIIHVSPDGDKIAFMKYANKTYGTGQDSTIEFSGESQIWIGDSTLEGYLLEDQWEEVTSPITWDTDNVTANDSAVTMYKLGKLRILRMSISVTSAVSGWTELATIASGHRPIENITMLMNNLGGTPDVRVIQYRSNGTIRCGGANASTSDSTRYCGYVVYRTA